MDAEKHEKRIQEAAVKAKKPVAENMMVVRLGYDTNIVVSMSQGTTILAALKNAEIYDTSDYNNPKIKPANRVSIETILLSYQEYLEMKIKHLLLGNGTDGR